MSRDPICASSTCWKTSALEDARVLVDADDYYASFVRVALSARRYLYLTGWQFDTQARLVRPEPGAALEHPAELMPFLSYLCDRTPSLDVFVTAWDYSLVYALEREWLQKLKFDFSSHERVHFRFLDHPEGGGSHHQKLVVVDGEVAFVGGLDLCDQRWDTRAHTPGDERRVDVGGKPYKAFHDVQVALSGPVVADLCELFRQGWQRAGGEGRLPHEGADDGARATQPLEVSFQGRGLPLAARRVAVSRTELVEVGQPVIGEIQALLERAIHQAEQLIYVENQYFTSRAIAQALTERLAAPDRSKLVIVMVMPAGADSPKEDFVLGNRQRAVRRVVAEVARRHGHEFRLLMSVDPDHPEEAPATFVHSKLLIVDDEMLTIGSANLTNRSMRVDRELNVSFETRLEPPEDAARLRHDIRALRASLIAEHAGYDDPAPFLSIDGLIARIDAACDDPRGKLRCQALPAPDGEDPLLIALFDPSKPLDWSTIDETLENAFDTDRGPLKQSLRKVGQRLGIVDIEE